MRVDLHIHTNASDGCWSLQRVVEGVQSQGIGLFAIADHDTVAGIAAAEELAREAGVAFLPGVEVSTRLDGCVFHVLAYGFEQTNQALVASLRENQARGNRASEHVLTCLIDMGYPIDLDEYAAYSYDRARGGWKVLNFLIDRGFCADFGEYVNELMVDVPSDTAEFIGPAAAITAVRDAGGVPILAHPGASLRCAGLNEKTLQPFLDRGIAGLECYSSYHDEATTRFCLDWCVQHDLLTSGGSDYHGGFVGRELGVPMVEVADLRLGELLERLGC